MMISISMIMINLMSKMNMTLSKMITIKEMINGKPEAGRKSSLEWMKGRSTTANTLYTNTNDEDEEY